MPRLVFAVKNLRMRLFRCAFAPLRALRGDFA